MKNSIFWSKWNYYDRMEELYYYIFISIIIFMNKFQKIYVI